ncbi:porin family protein [Hymenobacter sp. BT770]|uniref:porin family protein n=1 Tax=Hymenobacter sp. BT770 TaxID=2886942 RepID=UPI001D1281E5|nr:porin family protein [Hymenobacter sp. BT770]MCC3151615.1 PorT family protein [Hymenobacter sp. BT770]MDO3413807.1 porin family protein [Hymenobacter sp. BT770]
MRKAFTTSFLAGSILLGAMAHAQTRFRIGPTVGYNFSSCRIALPDLPDHRSISTSYRSGAEAGLVAQVSVSDHLAVQPAVLYAQKGYGLAQQYYNASADHTFREEYAFRFDYLTLPVNLVYSHRPAGRGAQVFAGPYAGYLLGGTRTTTTSDNSGAGSKVVDRDRYANTPNGKFPSRRPDLGFQAGVGYGFAGGLQVQAGYSQGVRTVGAAYEAWGSGTVAPPTYRNHGFQVAVAYLFGPKS